METSGKLSEPSLSMLTYSPEDSPAKTSVSPESVQESTESDPVCGQSTLGLLGSFDPGTYSLRTSQVSLLTNQCDEYSETFPRSGLMRNGTCYQLRSLALHTREAGFGRLPTPSARDYRDLSSKGAAYAAQRSRHQPSLVTESYLALVGGRTSEIYEWAMGFMIGWTDPASDRWETPLCHK